MRALFERILIWGCYFIDSKSLNTRRLPIPRTLSWTGWLLVLVYFGGLTAISTLVVDTLLGQEDVGCNFRDNRRSVHALWARTVHLIGGIS
jgi:hypothetical protein